MKDFNQLSDPSGHTVALAIVLARGQHRVTRRKAGILLVERERALRDTKSARALIIDGVKVETMLRVWNLLETRALYKTLRTLIPADQIDLLKRRSTS
jgi:hypothetical protein